MPRAWPDRPYRAPSPDNVFYRQRGDLLAGLVAALNFREHLDGLVHRRSCLRRSFVRYGLLSFGGVGIKPRREGCLEHVVSREEFGPVRHCLKAAHRERVGWKAIGQQRHVCGQLVTGHWFRRRPGQMFQLSEPVEDDYAIVGHRKLR